MVTLRLYRGGAPLVEMDLRTPAVEIGDRQGDSVRLDDLGVTGAAGGRIERRGAEWVFLPRGGGSAVPLETGRRLAIGNGWLELRDPDSPTVVDLASVPEGNPVVAVEGESRDVTKTAAQRLRLADDLRRALEEEGTSRPAALGRALDAAFQLVRAERGIAALLEPDGKSLRVVASHGLGGAPPRETLSRTVLDAVLKEGRDVFTRNAPVEIATQSLSLRDVRTLCAVPLRLRGRSVGLLYVDRSLLSPPLTEDDRAFLRLVATLVSGRLDEEERLEEADAERRRLQERLADRGEDEELGWDSAAMRAVKAQAERALVAFRGKTLPILVTGESGTGKEVLARWLHARVDGNPGRFVPVNCAAIPRDLAESELFGIEQGVASGVLRRLGKLQQADGGTLFLDEIGEMDLPVQAKMLRALESRRIVRVGGREEIPIDLRIVSATNAPMADAIHKGRFREDLYWRLCGIEIRMPPLRDRREDVPGLARQFLERFAREFALTPPRLSAEAVARLVAYGWPGNVRELRQRMGALAAMHPGEEVRPEHLPPEVLGRAAAEPATPAPVAPGGGPVPAEGRLRSLDEVEMEHIRSVLTAVGGDRGKAADILGIHRKTLARKLGAPEE